MLLEHWLCLRSGILSVRREQQIALALDTRIAVVQQLRLASLSQILGWDLLDAARLELLAEDRLQLAMPRIQHVRTIWEEVAAYQIISVLELVVSIPSSQVQFTCY